MFIDYRFSGRGVWVELDAERVAWCWQVARDLRADARAKGATDKHAERLALAGRAPSDDESLSIQAFGVIGEWAAAQVLGFHDWVPKIGVFLKESDLGFRTDVRTAHKKHYGMRVRSYEKPERASVFVLLHEIPDLRPTEDDIYKPGRALVVGWCQIGEVLGRSEWSKDFKTGGKAEITVPQEHLRSIEELCGLAEDRRRGDVALSAPISFTWHLEPDDDERWQRLADDQRALRDANRKALRAHQERERRAIQAIENAAKRAWIEAGNELRQPPEYRGWVWEIVDHEGVHPTAFPPIREFVGGELTEEFIAFQEYNQTRSATHPEYYCTRCKIRYNAKDGGLCGPCLGETQGPDSTPRSGRFVPPGTEYPL